MADVCACTSATRQSTNVLASPFALTLTIETKNKMRTQMKKNEQHFL